MINNKSRYDGLDIIDFLLIDYAANTPMDIFAYMDEDIKGFLNKPYHNLPDAEVINRIFRLYEKNYIAFTYSGIVYSVDKSTNKLPIAITNTEQLRLFLKREMLPKEQANELPEIVITEKGGKLWERIFATDWSIFYTAHFSYNKDEKFCLVATTKEYINNLLFRYLQMYPFKGNPDAAYVRLENWRVRYWKVLPTAFCLTYTAQNMEDKKLLSFDLYSIRDLLKYAEHASYQRSWRKFNVESGLREAEEEVLYYQSGSPARISGYNQIIAYLMELKNIVHFDDDKQSVNHVIYNALLKAINQMPRNPLVKALKKSLTIDDAVIPIDVSGVSEIQEVIDLLNHAFQKSGSEQGTEQSIKQWIKRGEHKGQVQQLLRQIQLKFGDISPSHKNALQNANSQTLLVWSERILTANSLEQLFGLEH